MAIEPVTVAACDPMSSARPAGATGDVPLRRTVQREEYLYRVGSHAMLVIVEWSSVGDRSPERRMRFAPWP